MAKSPDLCGLSGVNHIETHDDTELFFYLIGSGVTRSLFMLTAHHTQTRVLLFDLRVEADFEALASRARRAGTSADDQAVAITLDCARRIVDTGTHRNGAHFRLQIGAEREWLVPNVPES